MFRELAFPSLTLYPTTCFLFIFPATPFIPCKRSLKHLLYRVRRAGLLENRKIDQSRELSMQEMDCKEYFQKNTYQHTDRNYTVRIPFKNDSHELGQSSSRAVVTFHQLEKRFRKEKSLEKDYKEFVDEYFPLYSSNYPLHLLQKNH